MRYASSSALPFCLGIAALMAAGANAGCDTSLEAAFAKGEAVRVIRAQPFAKGDPLVLGEAITAQTVRAPDDLCLVKLVVGPGNPGPADAPSTSTGIGIEVWLPSPERWNGRIHAMGGGGFVGMPAASPDAIAWPYATFFAGLEGAVSSYTDTGHAATDGSWGMNPDGSLARNLWQDYSNRGIHEQAVQTKALTAFYYGKPAHHAYFEGPSTGGRQGYKLAQDYPDDYDGIIANLPAMNWAQWTVAGLYRSLVVERDLGGVALTEEQQDLVSNAAIRACDVVGDRHLGYILDNAACHYDPTRDAAVLCVGDGGNNATPSCVNRVQARAINKMWYGPTEDGSVPEPSVDNGVQATLEGKRLWFGLARGTSLYNAWFTRGAGARYVGLPRTHGVGYIADQLALQMQDPSIAEPTFRNASGNGQGRWKQLGYAEFAQAFHRGEALDVEFGGLATDKPDLSAFKARGGKMLSWHGWNDEAIPVQGTIRYYDRVLETMGGADRVHDFFRLYLVPGAGHMSPQGTANPAASPPIPGPGQFYQLIVGWVEAGIEPGMRLELESPDGAPEHLAQPACAYPQRAVFTGGNPMVSTSFACQ